VGATVKRPIVLLDSETTGLDPLRHGIWELATIVTDEDGQRREHLYRMEPDLPAAEPRALEINRYYERTAGMEHARHRPNEVHDLAAGNCGYWSSPKALAPCLALWLSGTTIVAANPTFDAGFLAAFLRRHGHAPTWHYRLRDIGSMAYGWLQGRAAGAQFLAEPGSDAARDHPDIPSAVPPVDASTDDFARALGIDVAQFERHSALGDCRLLGLMLDIIEGRSR
jgi:DNA polymerase III epsilon subunit-like protein